MDWITHHSLIVSINCEPNIRSSWLEITSYFWSFLLNRDYEKRITLSIILVLNQLVGGYSSFLTNERSLLCATQRGVNHVPKTNNQFKPNPIDTLNQHNFTFNCIQSMVFWEFHFTVFYHLFKTWEPLFCFPFACYHCVFAKTSPIFVVWVKLTILPISLLLVAVIVTSDM